MFNCIIKVNGRRNEPLISGTVSELERDYMLEEMIDAFNDLSNIEDEKSRTICTCIMEIAGDEEIVPVTTVSVSRKGKEQLQLVIDKFEQLYKSTNEGFMNNNVPLAEIFTS